MKHLGKLLLLVALVCMHAKTSAKDVDIPINIDSRIRTLVYNANEIFNINLKMGFQTIIELSNDESVELISIGDPYPWKITPIEKRIFLKPLQLGVRTNLTIITNKRTYLFDLSSDATSDENDASIIHVIRFYYPKTPIDKAKYSFNDYLSHKKGGTHTEMTAARGLTNKRIGNTEFEDSTQKSKTAINLSYSFTGEYNPATPVEIFDDRKDTFIRFRRSTIKPKIYSISNIGRKKLLRQKKAGDFTVVPGVHTKLYIKEGVYENRIYNDLKINQNT